MTLECKITKILLPFRLTWKNRATSDLIRAIKLVAEDTERIDAIDKEVYAVIGEARGCTWRGIESSIRRAIEQAWKHNKGYMAQLAGYPLDCCLTAAEFVCICARNVAWQYAAEDTETMT